MGRVVRLPRVGTPSQEPPLPRERRPPPPPKRRPALSGDFFLLAAAAIIWLGLNVLAYGALTSIYDLCSGLSPWLHWSWHPHWFIAQLIICAMGYVLGIAAELADREWRGH